MKRRKAVSHIKVMPSRSLAWAAQLKQRYARFTDFSRLSMLLYVPALARTLVLLQQRCFTSPVFFNAWHNNVSTPRMTLLNLFSLANLVARAGTSEAATSLAGPVPSTLEDIRRTRYITDYDNHRHLALTLAVNRTSTDLATTLSRKFQIQREAQVREVSTLLTQRVSRISEPSAMQTPMTFRAPAANRVTAVEHSVEVMRSRDAFERRSGPTTMPSVVPPALNVELLTDEVMKQIDRRVIARRERMGQI